MLKMLDTGEALRLMLAALALGVTVPVMVQLFLTLRQARQTLARLTAQVEPSLRLFNEIAQKPRSDPPPGSQLASIVATIVPAVIAAYRTFRQHQREETHESSSSSSLICDQDPAGYGRDMETENARQQP